MAESSIITLKDLSEVADLISGFAFKSSEFSKSGVPIVRISNITDHEDVQILERNQPFFSGEINEKISKYLLKEGDILIALSGATTGKIGLYKYKEPALLNQRIALIRPKDGKSYKYLYYFLQTMSQKILQDAYGGAQPNVSPKTLGKYKLNFPDDENESNLIVDELEKQLTRLYDSIKTFRTIKYKLKVYKKTLLNNLFDIPSAKIKKLKEVTEKIQDGSHFSPKKQYSESRSGLYLYITARNVRNNHMNLSNLIYVEKDFFDTIYPRCDPKEGDVLLTKDGANTGMCCLNSIKEPFALLSSVAMIRGKENILDNRFLLYYLQSPKGLYGITGKMTGTAIKRIILKRIKEAQIPIIPIEEQKQIFQEIESHFSVIDKLQEVIESSLNKAEKLRKSILKSAFEGKLVKNISNLKNM